MVILEILLKYISNCRLSHKVCYFMYKDKMVIAHFVGLNGIGGVQSNFVEYMKSVKLEHSTCRHKVYTMGDMDEHYQLDVNVLNIRKISNLYKLVLDIVSKKVVVHFYNNLSSLKVALFLAVLPVKKLIVHERGTIWNQKSSSWIVPRFVAWKASIVLSNSFATQAMLIQKFSINRNKIRVIHNGINTTLSKSYGSKYKKDNSIFNIGFIGRLDSPKGVHVLINAMQYLANERVELVIAGEGVLLDILKKSASFSNNIRFIGRVQNPYEFMKKLDLLVVPSIREPLGNVCLEAGLCKTPVLAANIDGIPEIIENNITGVLIEANDDILIKFPEDSIPLPEFVVDPVSLKLREPKQINAFLLAQKIIDLSKHPALLSTYANKLNEKVIKHFSIDRYKSELYDIYREIYFS